MSAVQHLATDQTSQQSEVRASRAIGAIFFTVFGAAWLVLWCLQVYGAALGVLLIIVAAGVGLLLLSSAQFRRNRSAYRANQGTPRRLRQSRAFNIINAAQWAIIIVGASVLTKLNQSIWIMPFVIFTIGAHFIPVGVVFKSKARYVIGIALMLVALVYPHLTDAGPASSSGPFCAGLILWAGAIASLIPYRYGDGAVRNE
ncbi:hypothetical protein PQR14_02880 [Paraburkholderia bryophila]|uniref:Signal transduction histidine kinase n=2 Tax=Paraburkholderia TaxID=1822464 RepID=A0A7Y9WQL0_9BURK|nr:hypothetical protein [Paraburkholderia bryophila]NYH25196.1 signal transduction histidine kinase [Paraburkholderia bryophila]